MSGDGKGICQGGCESGGLGLHRKQGSLKVKLEHKINPIHIQIKKCFLSFFCEGYKVNVLEMKSLEAAHAQILEDFGPCDILVNGAGGNHPSATTDNEYHHEAKEGQKTFFDRAVFLKEKRPVLI